MEAIFLAPQVALVPAPRGRLVPKARLQGRVTMFAAGDWVTLLQTSLDASIKGTTARCSRRRGHRDTIQAEEARALGLVHMGELSNARQGLEGEETWKVLTDGRNDDQSRENHLTHVWRKWTRQCLSIWTLICCFRIYEIIGEVRQEDRLA